MYLRRPTNDNKEYSLGYIYLLYSFASCLESGQAHGKCVEDFFVTDLMCSPFSFERTMDPSKAHYTLSHGQVAHVDKSEPDINVTVATSRVPPEMTVQGQRSEKGFVW